MNSTTASIILMDSLLSEHPTVSREIKIKAIADFCQSKAVARLIPKEVFEKLAKEMFEKLAVVIPAMIQPTTIAQFGQILTTTVDGSFCTPLSTVVQSRFNELFDKVLEIFTTEVLPLLKAELSSKGKGKKTIAKPKEVPVSNDQAPTTQHVTSATEIDLVKMVLRKVLSGFAVEPEQNDLEANRAKGRLILGFFGYSWIDDYLPETAKRQLLRYNANKVVVLSRKQLYKAKLSLAGDLEFLVNETARSFTFPHRYEELLWHCVYWFYTAIVPELRVSLAQLEANGEQQEGGNTESPMEERLKYSSWQAWITPPPPPAVPKPFAAPALDEAVSCIVNRLMNQPVPQQVVFQQPYSGMRGPDGRPMLPTVSPIKKLLQVLGLRRTMAAQVAIWVLQLLDQHEEWGDAMQAALNNVVEGTNVYTTDTVPLEAPTPSAKLAHQLRCGLLAYINSGDSTIVNAILDTLNQVLEPLGNI